MDLVSVIIPVYNREDLIQETVNSVLNQFYNNWELIIVDDGSTDKTSEICLNYQKSDARIRFFERDQHTRGASACRNIGLNQAKGKWIVFLDSDDLLAPWCLTQRIQTILDSNEENDFLVFPMLYFKNKFDDLMILQNVNTNLHPLDRFLQLENVWLMSSLIWKKSFLMSLNGFNESAVSFQDWEINVKALIKSKKWIFSDQLIPDNFYRQHPETISKDRFSKLHLTNNCDTFINCFDILKKTEMFSTYRKDYFKKIIFEWLNRLSGIALQREERTFERKKIILRAKQANLFSESESENVLKYFILKDNPILFRFKILFNVRTYFIRKSIFDLFPDKNCFVKNQGKHIYTGLLHYNFNKLI